MVKAALFGHDGRIDHEDQKQQGMFLAVTEGFMQDKLIKLLGHRQGLIIGPNIMHNR
jgi:hypothetical protein